MDGIALKSAGEAAMVVEFEDVVDPAVSRCVLDLARRLESRRIPGLIETVPSFRSLLIQYEPLVLAAEDLAASVRAALAQGARGSGEGRRWRFPVCYDPRVAPDLEAVAAATGLTPEMVAQAHASRAYHVYMLGFLPGQPYLGALDEALRLPRRASPRAAVPAGSVGIVTSLTTIYPRETPCGWHVIGRSPAPVWAQSGALLAPGDVVSFEPIALEEFDGWRERPAASFLEPALAEAA